MRERSADPRRQFDRRHVLLSAAGGLSACTLGLSAPLLGSAVPKRTRLGVCIHSYMIRPRAERPGSQRPPFADPLTFLEHCRRLGAAGIQVGLGVKDAAYTAKLRRLAETHQMFIEGTAGLPADGAGVERFEAQVRTAKQAGARVIRVVIIPGRRYERFTSAEQFRRAAERGRRSLELAEPVAARHGIRLAVENHKGQRIDERLALLKQISSEYVGMCVDTGNSIALLEDPLEVVRAYAPWAHSVHLKDQALREYEDGFLLGDVPLGEGILDLPEMIRTLRQAQPEIRFTLEMHTRDPLRVPCLTEKYWATMSEVPGRDLARMLRTVRANASDQPLPRVSHLPLERQIAREEENVKKCLAFAGERLRL